ncbi:MAG: F0F1 ATP synthase subunit epsilon [Phycisphaerae bacterium]|nr:F0F1 ATP synthase subunit epsilon [Phycisphaerae bacterium]
MTDTDVKKLSCEINTPDGNITVEDVVSVQLPALDGYMGIMANRAPVVAALSTGVLTLQMQSGEDRELFVSRGFCQVTQNLCRILTEECLPLGELDPERAWDILQRAYKLPSDTSEQRELRDEAIAAGRTRFRIAQKNKAGMISLDEMMSRGMK